MIQIALAERTTQDDLDDVAVSAGWLLLNIVPATATFPAQIIWVTADRQTQVHFVDDPRVEAIQALIQGADEEAMAAVVRDRLAASKAPPSP